MSLDPQTRIGPYEVIAKLGPGEGRSRPRLLLEAGEPFRVHRERGRQDLDRHLAPEARVASAIHLAHTARAKGVEAS